MLIPPQGWPMKDFKGKGVKDGSVHKALTDLVIEGKLAKDGSHYVKVNS